MTILLPTLAVAFAAFCVWLTVRIVNRKERWAKRTLGLAIDLPDLYLASFGAACWFAEESCSTHGDVMCCVPHAYWPVGWMATRGPGFVSNAIRRYGKSKRGQVHLLNGPVPFCSPSCPQAGEWKLNLFPRDGRRR